MASPKCSDTQPEEKVWTKAFDAKGNPKQEPNEQSKISKTKFQQSTKYKPSPIPVALHQNVNQSLDNFI